MRLLMFCKVYMRKFYMRKYFALNKVIMKMFASNCIDLTYIIYYLSKTVLNFLVVVKRSFWQYDLSLIFTKVLKELCDYIFC